ncbi:MAG: hypothetical protein ACYSUY_21490, partial [Planctomycetota bacterium]
MLLKAGDKSLFEQRVDIGPDRPFTREVAVPVGTKEEDLKITLLSSTNDTLIAYQPVKRIYNP